MAALAVEQGSRRLANHHMKSISLWLGGIWAAVLVWWLFRTYGETAGGAPIESTIVMLVVAGFLAFPLSLVGIAFIAIVGPLLPPLDPLSYGIGVWLILGVCAWVQWAVLVPMLARGYSKRGS
jgi:ABC-type dipeptide/oligopeptide/nickel transport system permease subunit